MIKLFNIICNKCRVILRRTTIEDLTYNNRNTKHYCDKCKLNDVNTKTRENN